MIPLTHHAARVLPAAAALCLLGVGLWVFTPSVVDDAFISFRYASNLAHGHGLVFNPGEHVEGFSNFLWTVLLAGFAALGADLELSARVTGWCCLGAALICCWFLAGRLGLRRRWRLSWLVFLCGLPPLTYWAGAGLETPLFVLLTVASRAALLGVWRGASPYGAAALLVLLPLCRPDGVLLVGAGLGVWLVSGRRRGALLRCAIVVIAGGGLYAAWKLSTFGALLPNTFHAKVHAPAHVVDLGLQYLRAFFTTCPWALLSLAAPILLLTRPGPAAAADAEKAAGDSGGPAAEDGAADTLWKLLWIDGAAGVIYVQLVGGDLFPFSRFMTHLLPGLSLLLVLGAARLRWPPRAAAAAVAALGLFSFGHHFAGEQARQAVMAHRLTRMGIVVGRYLSRWLPRDALIAANAAGALPYFAGRPTLDTLGLTDAHIARVAVSADLARNRGHARGDGPYVLRRSPAVIFFGNTVGARQPVYFSDWDLARQKDHARLYRLVEVDLNRMDRGPRPATRALRTLITLREPGPPRIYASLGVMERTVAAGLVSLGELWTFDPTVRFWLRRDLPLPPE